VWVHLKITEWVRQRRFNSQKFLCCIFVDLFFFSFLLLSFQGANILLNDQGEVKLGKMLFTLSAQHCTGVVSMSHSPQRCSSNYSKSARMISTEELNPEHLFI